MGVMECQEKSAFHLATKQLRFIIMPKVDLIRPNCFWQTLQAGSLVGHDLHRLASEPGLNGCLDSLIV